MRTRRGAPHERPSCACPAGQLVPRNGDRRVSPSQNRLPSMHLDGYKIGEIVGKLRKRIAAGVLSALMVLGLSVADSP